MPITGGTSAAALAADPAFSGAYVARANATTPSAAVEIWSADTTGHGDFRWVVEDTFVFNGTWDPVMKFGYNVGQDTPGEACLHWTIEGDYNTGTGRFLEGHLEGTTEGGVARRPLTFTVHRTSGVAAGSIQADSMNFMDSTATTLLAQILTNRIDLNQDTRVVGTSAAARSLTVTNPLGDVYLILDGKAANNTILAFQRDAATKWQEYLSGSNILNFRDMVNARMHMQFVGGASATAAVTYHSAIFRMADATLWQTTVGAAGAASALPVLPTKYLKVLDETGASLVVPAYAA